MNLVKPIIYLEGKDFDTKGNLIRFKDSKLPKIIMIQANFCGHCTDAKPAYQEFAQKYAQKVLCFSIEADVNKDEWGPLLKLIKPSFQGFPDYLLVGEKSKKINGRSVNSIKEFVNIKE